MAQKAIVVVYNRIPELTRALPDEVGQIVEQTMTMIESDAKLSMLGPHTGQMYGKHQASAPGEAPAVDTGHLRAGIQGWMTSKVSAVVGVLAEYGAALEYGTTRMAARPFMTPAAEKGRRWFMAQMKDLEGRLRR